MNLYLVTGFVVFLIGAVGVLFRKDAISLFMCVEVMLNGINITLVAFSRMWGDMQGQLAVLFVIGVAAAEAAIGLALMLQIFKHKGSIQLNELTDLREMRD